ncbi:hypothetical protein [Marinobacterium sediminicola]|uniref:Uncharacterized protein n=1 Tax=Marinobacterium sediminicola TaxID=518898 RepID=A0ABY1RXR6_9GAMM|nr:hypothetical protein [Marinobacterium sediminicola]ULG68557.1 hypothetical protein LN244_12745 [Marinobacterium sediminicola]SMR73071.1 hypothetical protein SAMN04487964_10310 [Marinobacterium sediminicola]
MQHVILIGFGVFAMTLFRVLLSGADILPTLAWVTPLVAFVYFVLDPMGQFGDD